MKKTILAAYSISALLFTTALHAEPSKDTREFITKAALTDMFEVESSKIALQRSENSEVKKFANQMIADHNSSTANLKAAVGKSKTATSADLPKALDSKHNEMLADLRKEDVKDFDEEYVGMQKKGHDKAVDLFKDYAEDGDDAVLKDFAGKTLPTLKTHQDHVKHLKDSLK